MFSSSYILIRRWVVSCILEFQSWFPPILWNVYTSIHLHTRTQAYLCGSVYINRNKRTISLQRRSCLFSLDLVWQHGLCIGFHVPSVYFFFVLLLLLLPSCHYCSYVAVCLFCGTKIKLVSFSKLPSYHLHLPLAYIHLFSAYLYIVAMCMFTLYSICCCNVEFRLPEQFSLNYFTSDIWNCDQTFVNEMGCRVCWAVTTLCRSWANLPSNFEKEREWMRREWQRMRMNRLEREKIT